MDQYQEVCRITRSDFVRRFSSYVKGLAKMKQCNSVSVWCICETALSLYRQEKGVIFLPQCNTSLFSKANFRLSHTMRDAVPQDKGVKLKNIFYLFIYFLFIIF